MNTISKLAFAAAATAALGTVTSDAYAGSNMQGPQLTGITLQSIESSQPVVTAVTLPSGESVDLPQQAAD